MTGAIDIEICAGTHFRCSGALRRSSGRNRPASSPCIHCGFAANAGSPQSQSCYLFVFAVARNHRLRYAANSLVPSVPLCGCPQLVIVAVCLKLSRAVDPLCFAVDRNEACGWPHPCNLNAVARHRMSCISFLAACRKHLPSRFPTCMYNSHN